MTEDLNFDFDDITFDPISEALPTENTTLPLLTEEEETPTSKKRAELEELKKQTLLEKYKGLEVEDTTEIDDLRNDRHKLSERLENDPAFRRKYIESENNRVLNKLIAEEEEKENESEKVKKIMKQTESLDDVPDDCSDDGSVNSSFDPLTETKNNKECPQKAGVYIHHVANLTINIQL